MRLLLDTHALIWWLESSSRLSRRAARAMADERNTIVVSAASAFEIAMKVRLGRLSVAARIADHPGSVIVDEGFEALDITVEHARRAGELPGLHADPFDRLLVAQSKLEGLRLVSSDEVLDALGAERYW